MGLIDCDIHQPIASVDEFVEYVEPGQREFFRAQGPMLGLPDYPWPHPGTWYREDLEIELDRPGATVSAVQREVLDAHDVDIGVLNGEESITVSVMASAYRATAFARAYHEWVRERWLDADPRFRASIIVPAQDPVAAVREIERTAVDERFIQVLLCGGAERPYGDPRYLPIFAAAVERGLPVAIHTGGEGLGIAAPPSGAGNPSLYIEWHTVGSASSVMAHLVSLISHGVFERFPDLKLIFLEGGLAWVPGLMWRLDTNWRALRNEIPWLTRLPSEVLREQIRFTTQPLEHTSGDDELLFRLLETIGAPDTLCYSSDYPHWDYDDPTHVLRRLPADWRDAVMRGNSESLYGSRLGLVAS